MFVSWSCYFSLQHTPQWAVCLFGCSWARQIDSFIDTQAQKQKRIYKYIYAALSVHRATVPGEHKTDSLYSGLKWTEGYTWGSEAKASGVGRLTQCLRVDRFHNKLCTPWSLWLPCNCPSVLDSVEITQWVSERDIDKWIQSILQSLTQVLQEDWSWKSHCYSVLYVIGSNVIENSFHSWMSDSCSIKMWKGKRV